MLTHGAADEAVELWEAYGPPLDEAQKIALRAAMGVRADGVWATSVMGRAVSRQNGKGDEIQARELWGLVMGGEGIIHTTHHGKTTKNALERLDRMLESHSDLRRLRKKTYRGSTYMAIEMKSGAFVNYQARSDGAGRGLDDISLVVYDEAQHLQSEHMAASSPTLATNVNAQVWLAGSAGLSRSEVWWQLRKEALGAAPAPRVAWVEHTAEHLEVDGAGELSFVSPDPFSRDAWYEANPALGSRIDEEYFETQIGFLGPELFAREHLGVWDPVPETGGARGPIGSAVWEMSTDPSSKVSFRQVLAVDVAPDSLFGALGVASTRPDGRKHVEVVDTAPGVGWVVARFGELLRRHQFTAVAWDKGGPVESLVPDLLKVAAGHHGLEVIELPGREYAASCQAFVDDVDGDRVRHLGQAWLSAAVGGARKRRYGELWVWDRWGAVDVTPLVAVTVAARALGAAKERQMVSVYESSPVMSV